jgi:HTH-type transcriptional repressor of NAD biosynthesis genes
MTTGFIVGKFAPLTTGHINFINHASTKCDKLLVLLSYDEYWRLEQKPYMKQRLTLRNRLKWLKETYYDLDHIIIDYVDETDIPPYPHGWKEFQELVKEKLVSHFGTEKTDYVFSSEPEYDAGFNKYFPETKHLILDKERELFPMSATKVRSDVFKNWDSLPSSVRKEFVFKVCLIGTESTGKSTLTKYLAKMFATSWVEEYGRKFCEIELHGDESLLDYQDYATIAFRHKESEEDAAKTANRVMFSDTNAFVTGYYQYLYEGDIDAIVEGIIKREDYDLILYTDNDVKWFDDGLRKNGSVNERENTKKIFEDLLKKYNIEYKKISGTYEERLQKAYEIVKTTIGDVK